MDPFLIIIFIVSIIGTFYGTIVGGAAILVVPVLIISGLPPQVAVATTKLNALGLTTSGIYTYNKGEKVNYKIGITLAIPMTIGSVIGSYILLATPDNILKFVIIGIMAVIILFTLLHRKLGIENRKKSITTLGWLTASILSFFFGIYIGFFGGGVGTLLSFMLLAIFGQTFLESAGTRKVMALPAIIVSLVIFTMNGKIAWEPGIVLLAGSLIGSYLGASYAMKKGDEWVRKVFIVISVVFVVEMILI